MQFIHRHDKALLLLILITSTLLKIIYVFYFTEYTSYLQSDAGAYWERANHRFLDQPLTMTQWWVWPPFNHIMLSYFFDFVSLTGLADFRHEATLFANILFSTASAGLFYFTARNWGLGKPVAIVLTTLLGFFFPLIYLNAFVLSETPALFFLSLTLFCIVRKNITLRLILLGGAAIAIAAAFKPSLGISALPLGLYVLFKDANLKVNLFHAAIFSIGFVIAITPVVYENYRISDGEMKGLGAAAGINYFMKQCRVHKLEYKKPGFYYVFIPAMTVDKPYLGSFTGQQPFHKQEYYFSLGHQCVSANSNIWQENLLGMTSLFFGPFYPGYYNADGFRLLMPASRVAMATGLLLAMTGVFLSFFGNNRRQAFLLLAMILSISSVYYFLNVDHRHVYSILLPILLLAGFSIQQCCQETVKYRWWVLASMIMISTSMSFYFYQYQYKRLTEKHSALFFEAQNIPDLPAQRSDWNTPGFFKLFENGITITFKQNQLTQAHELTLSLDNNDVYQVTLMNGSDSLQTLQIGPALNGYGMTNYNIQLNDSVREKSADKLIIRPLSGDRSYSLGGMRII